MVNSYMPSGTLEFEDTTIHAIKVVLLAFSVCQC